MDIRELLRENIRTLAPYSTARDEYQGELGIYLDANENPYDNNYNRYPDPHQKNLKRRLAEIKGVPVEKIFIGNGSDEPIDLVFRLFCEPRRHNAVSIAPTYGMYKVAAAINDVQMREVQLEPGFTLDAEKLLAAADENTRLLFLCSPNNPTGTVLHRDALAAWVDYARRHGALIIYDAAYEAFIKDTDSDVPHSIFEIPGAEEVAVECRSFSKTAGFTGLRCAFTTIPAAVTIPGPDGSRVRLQDMWKRRQSTKYNGCPYIVQRAAEAVYSPEGQEQVRATIAAYMANAARIRSGIEGMGLSCYGGIHAPYIWVKTPDGMGSWEFFDLLLSRTSLVCTPGAGFGPSGEGYVRFTAFGSEEDTTEALERLQGLSL